jgi:hypothetical protein
MVAAAGVEVGTGSSLSPSRNARPIGVEFGPPACIPWVARWSNPVGRRYNPLSVDPTPGILKVESIDVTDEASPDLMTAPRRLGQTVHPDPLAIVPAD